MNESLIVGTWDMNDNPIKISAVDELLVDACIYGDADRLVAAIARGGDIYAITPSGGHVIRQAIKYDHPHLLPIFVAHGFDLDARSESDTTAIMRAAGWGKVSSLSALIELGANVHLEDDYGSTALIDAASWDEMQCMRLLIDAGADPAYVSVTGITAIGQAMVVNRPQSAAFLVGQEPHLAMLPYSKGVSILDEAKARGYSELVTAWENYHLRKQINDSPISGKHHRDDNLGL